MVVKNSQEESVKKGKLRTLKQIDLMKKIFTLTKGFQKIKLNSYGKQN